MSKVAHVWRYRDYDSIPPEHAAVVLGDGPFKVTYWDNGWHEFRSGYNMHNAALADANYLSRNVIDHTG